MNRVLSYNLDRVLVNQSFGHLAVAISDAFELPGLHVLAREPLTARSNLHLDGASPLVPVSKALRPAIYPHILRVSVTCGQVDREGHRVVLPLLHERLKLIAELTDPRDVLRVADPVAPFLPPLRALTVVVYDNILVHEGATWIDLDRHHPPVVLRPFHHAS